MFRCSHRSHTGNVARCAPEARSCPKLKSPRGRPGSLNVVCAAAATASMRTHYDVLGVRDSASVRDIKDAFRRLALMWHPDRCKQPGAKDKFMELKAAYDTLVDLTARAKYDLQLKQVSQPQATGPSTVGHDWSKYRSTNVRRSSSIRKTAPQQDGFTSSGSAMPPRPTARASSGDDFDALSRMAAGVASGAQGSGGHAAYPAAGRAASASARTASASAFRFGSTTAGVGASGGYRSIFSDDPPAAGTSHSSSTSSSSGGDGGGNPIFTRTASASAYHQQTARATSAFSRSSSRSSSRSHSRAASRSRYGSSSTSWSTRASSPSPAQQWHSQYCHSGDDFVPSTGTSFAATTALVRASAYASSTSGGSSSSSSCGAHAAWHAGAAGDGFALRSAAETAVQALPALVAAADPVPTWPSSASRVAVGDDYADNQAALVRVERQETLPIRATPMWDRLASFISVRM